MKGLIVKPYWADLILSGEKIVELRGSNTKIRGKIGIVKSGTKKVFGEVELIDSMLISDDEYYNMSNLHKVDVSRESIPYKKLYGWVLKNPVVYEEPIPYNHKVGCVVWVNID